MASPNVNYDDILSTTLANYKTQLVDNVFSARPLAYFLKQAGQIRMVSGGEKIVIPLIYAENSTAGSYSMYDTLDTTPQDGISAAEYPWKQYAVSVTIAGMEEAKNNSEEQIIDLLEARIMQAEETITEQWDTMFLGDGTGNGGKNWNGLGNLVAQNSTAVGGIDPSSNAFWQSHIDSSSADLKLKKIDAAYNSVSVGNDRPNLILTSQTAYEYYTGQLQANMRYTDTKVGAAGFLNLLYKDTPVMYDKNVTASEMYFLNTKYLRLTGHTDVWFKPTPFKSNTNQDAKYAQILCYGNLTISNRARQGVITAATFT